MPVTDDKAWKKYSSASPCSLSHAGRRKQAAYLDPPHLAAKPKF